MKEMHSTGKVPGAEHLNPPEQGWRFNADVTKLLAADSFLQSNLPQDPEAEHAFCSLTSMLANPITTGFFHRAHLVEAQLGAVGRCWVDNSQPTQPRAIDNSMRMDRPKAELFAKWYGGPEAQRVVDWLRFQSQESLMRIFWQDNREDDLKETYDCLCAFDVDLTVLQSAIARAKHENGLRLYDLSARALATLQQRFRFDWNDHSLALAYIAWTYLKGFRYVSGLGNRDIYAVHFTREHVFDSSTGWAPVQCKTAPLFPWGELLSAHLPFLRQADYADVILGLRAYTRVHLNELLERLGSIQSGLRPEKSGEAGSAFKRAMGLTKEFAADGMRAVFPAAAADAVMKRIDRVLLGAAVASLLGPPLPYVSSAASMAELYLQIVMLAMSRDAKRSAAECISLVQTNWQIKSSVSKRPEILTRFLRDRGFVIPAQ